jgi:hypothetical protein
MGRRLWMMNYQASGRNQTCLRNSATALTSTTELQFCIGNVCYCYNYYYNCYYYCYYCYQYYLLLLLLLIIIIIVLLLLLLLLLPLLLLQLLLLLLLLLLMLLPILLITTTTTAATTTTTTTTTTLVNIPLSRRWTHLMINEATAILLRGTTIFLGFLIITAPLISDYYRHSVWW